MNQKVGDREQSRDSCSAADMVVTGGQAGPNPSGCRCGNKGRQWVRAKYFTAHGGRHWIFTGQIRTAGGEKRRCGCSPWLPFRFSDTSSFGTVRIPSTRRGRLTSATVSDGRCVRPNTTGSGLILFRRIFRHDAACLRYRSRQSQSAPRSPVGRNEKLEPDAGKLASPVLRGGVGGNTAPLPGETVFLRTIYVIVFIELGCQPVRRAGVDSLRDFARTRSREPGRSPQPAPRMLSRLARNG